MILIVGFESDPHVQEVRRFLHAEPLVFDTGEFPATVLLDARFSSESASLRVLREKSRWLDLGTIGAVWYRRINPLGLDPAITDTTARLFAWSEANEALLGVWYALDCFWMNPPTADEIALRKIRQLQVARRLGLSIPETLVTNNPEAATEFIQSRGPGEVIRKAFRNIREAPRETAVVTQDDLRLIDSVRFTPVIFQRFIPGRLDLRVTIVDGEFFAASIESEPGYEADYRTGLRTANVRPFTLPTDIADRLTGLMEAFNLRYGAVDLRVTPDGEYVFFEVNPAGEYMFISQRTDQPISAAIAAALERHDGEASAHVGGEVDDSALSLG
jgi:glutathione synthase/RimK-type ligase-like ATP-grasp enzyme